MAATLGVGLLALASLLPGVVASLAASTTLAISESGDRSLGGAQLVGSLGNEIAQMLALVLPLALLVLATGVAANLVSGGLIFSIRTVRFDTSRLNPITGLRRIVDRQALVRLAIASAKLGLLAVVDLADHRQPRALARLARRLDDGGDSGNRPEHHLPARSLDDDPSGDRRAG